MDDIDDIMIKIFKYIRQKITVLKIDEANLNELISGLVNLYYSIFCEDKIYFMKNNKAFEWRTFENELRPDNMKNIFSKLDI